MTSAPLENAGASDTRPAIYLASASPRRREILTRAGIPHEVLPSGADENVAQPLPPGDLSAAVALRKAEAVRGRVGGPAVILAADTVVAVHADGRVLGKPADEADAFAMLKTLQGRAHTVYTGVSLIYVRADGADIRQSFTEQARVTFRPLTDAALRRYIATGEPMDKAGAYGIQGRGAALITRVEGDFYTVMGLPLARLCMALEDWGFVV